MSSLVYQSRSAHIKVISHRPSKTGQLIDTDIPPWQKKTLTGEWTTILIRGKEQRSNLAFQHRRTIQTAIATKEMAGRRKIEKEEGLEEWKTRRKVSKG
ncbi:hypothetical protein NCC49_005497 [Naganishia albida]|nr:hypothetical protein NCC49_005497 [Naganishia albida]